MKEKIKKFILRNRHLKYAYIFMSNRKNEKFIDDVFRLREDPLLLNVNNRGNLYPNNYICEIKPVRKNEGFFSIFRRTLNGLYFSDFINAVPYIFYTQDFLYCEKHEINGAENPFEYYFEQVSNISQEEVSQSKLVIDYSIGNNRLAESLNYKYGISYHVQDEYIEALGNVMRKYIRLNKPTCKYIYDSINRVIHSKKTLAIHVRGTDYRKHYKFHPNMLQPSDYFPIIDKAIEEEGFEQIFLATDDSEMLSLFKVRYNSMLVYYDDVFRGNNSEGVHTSNANREHHHYLLGLEVLRDMYTLAACDGFIAGMSQVSMAARIAKASSGEKFKYIKIIDKGLVQSGKIY